MSMRDEFESRFAGGYGMAKDELNQYVNADTAAAWDGWQDACEQGAEPVAEVIPNVVGIEMAWIDPSNKPPVGTKLYTQPQSAGVPEGMILRKQAEAVVPAIMVAGREFGRGDLTNSALRMFAEDYAQRLRQQADELEQK